MKKQPAKKKESVTSLVKKLITRVSKLEKQVKELKHEIKRLDMEEITELHPKLNQPLVSE
jgi:phage shock protein A